MILIVGNAWDLHVSHVADLLRSRGAETTVIDPNDTSSVLRLSYSLQEDDPPHAHREGWIASPFEDVSSVWWRPKPTVRQMQGLSFKDREWQFALEGLEALTRHAFWINPRPVDQRLRHKPGQLIDAQRAGFETPPTLVSNDARIIADFLRQYGGEAIYKTLSWYGGSLHDALFTNRICLADIDRFSDNIIVAPGIFQPYIEKDHELRITIVGDRLFAARIDSQAHPDTKTDWRRHPSAVHHRKVDLPHDLAQRLMAFHRSQGLVYGAYDFIVTPDGRYVFLEVNSVGQWLWLEDMAGLTISDAIADCLVRRA